MHVLMQCIACECVHVCVCVCGMVCVGVCVCVWGWGGVISPVCLSVSLFSCLSVTAEFVILCVCVCVRACVRACVCVRVSSVIQCLSMLTFFLSLLHPHPHPISLPII